MMLTERDLFKYLIDTAVLNDNPTFRWVLLDGSPYRYGGEALAELGMCLVAQQTKSGLSAKRTTVCLCTRLRWAVLHLISMLRARLLAHYQSSRSAEHSLQVAPGRKLASASFQWFPVGCSGSFRCLLHDLPCVQFPRQCPPDYKEFSSRPTAPYTRAKTCCNKAHCSASQCALLRSRDITKHYVTLRWSQSQV